MLHVKRLQLIYCVFVVDKKKLFTHLDFSFPGFHKRAMYFLLKKYRSKEICLFNELILIKMQAIT